MKLLKVHLALRWGGLLLICASALFVGKLLLNNKVARPAARQALPNSARDIQEYYSRAWNGTFVAILKARMPESDYEEYAKKLGLVSRFDRNAHEDIWGMLNIGVHDAPTWWNPPPATDSTFFQYHQGDTHIQVLRYSEDHAYFVASSWW